MRLGGRRVDFRNAPGNVPRWPSVTTSCPSRAVGPAVRSSATPQGGRSFVSEAAMPLPWAHAFRHTLPTLVRREPRSSLRPRGRGNRVVVAGGQTVTRSSASSGGSRKATGRSSRRTSATRRSSPGGRDRMPAGPRGRRRRGGRVVASPSFLKALVEPRRQGARDRGPGPQGPRRRSRALRPRSYRPCALGSTLVIEMVRTRRRQSHCSDRMVPPRGAASRPRP